MKSGFAFVFSFIHVIALTSGVNEMADQFQWSTTVAVLGFLAATGVALIPIVRTIAWFGILFCLMIWWKALLLAPITAFALFLIETTGVKMLKANSNSQSFH